MTLEAQDVLLRQRGACDDSVEGKLHRALQGFMNLAVALDRDQEQLRIMSVERFAVRILVAGTAGFLPFAAVELWRWIR
jgi:hypothetical protein